MKKIFLLLILGSVLFSKTVFAATTPSPTSSISPTPSTNPTSVLNGLDKQINNLKDRIASRVAQLKLVEKRGIIGTITDLSENQITISDSEGNIHFIDVDELTKFSSPSAKTSFGISDLTKGSTVGAIGLYNKESRRILARFVDVMVLPVSVSGAILDIDSANYTFTISTPDGKNYLADVGNITKTYVYQKDTGMVKSGFSKLQLNERVIVVGYFDIKNNNKIVASRIIRLPSIAVNPKISLTLLSPTPLPPTPTVKAQSTLKK